MIGTILVVSGCFSGRTWANAIAQQIQPVVKTRSAAAPQYRIQAGDTLSHIAGRYCTTVEALLAVNRGNPAVRSRHLIFAGQALTLAIGEKCTSPVTVEPKVQPEKSTASGRASRAESFVVPQSGPLPSKAAPSAPVSSPVTVADCASILATGRMPIIVRSAPAQPARPVSEAERVHCIRVQYGHIIAVASREQRVPESLIIAVILVESAGWAEAIGYPADFVPTRDADKVSYGLMQLTWPTARHFRDPLRPIAGGADIFDPERNIRAGTRTFAHYWRSVAGGDLCLGLAAYNMGPAAVRRLAVQGIQPCTIGYVRRVHAALARLRALPSP